MLGIFIISTVAGVYRGEFGIPLKGKLNLSPDPITVDARAKIPDPLPISGEGISWETIVTGAEKKG